MDHKIELCEMPVEKSLRGGWNWWGEEFAVKKGAVEVDKPANVHLQ
jgi:hypothetical protein